MMCLAVPSQPWFWRTSSSSISGALEPPNRDVVDRGAPVGITSGVFQLECWAPSRPRLGQVAASRPLQLRAARWHEITQVTAIISDMEASQVQYCETGKDTGGGGEAPIVALHGKETGVRDTIPLRWCSWLHSGWRVGRAVDCTITEGLNPRVMGK